MNLGNMTRIHLLQASLGLVWALCSVGTGQAESILTVGNLGAVEYRALMAQSLIQQVEEMKGESDQLRQEIAERDVQLREAMILLDQRHLEVERLHAKLQEWEKDIEKRDELLSVFRRGAFEYYEVRTGDTLESIAANPMVYGDPVRAIWLEQANALSADQTLTPGTVLIIPRFPEGTSYDL